MKSLAVPSKRQGSSLGKSRQAKRPLRDNAALNENHTDDELSSDDDDVGRHARLDEEDAAHEREEMAETADEKRLRVAQAYVQRVKADIAAQEGPDEHAEEAPDDEDGARDSLVASVLQQQQREESGRLLRPLAERSIPQLVCAKVKSVNKMITFVTCRKKTATSYSIF